MEVPLENRLMDGRFFLNLPLPDQVIYRGCLFFKTAKRKKRLFATVLFRKSLFKRLADGNGQVPEGKGLLEKSDSLDQDALPGNHIRSVSRHVAAGHMRIEAP